MIRAWCGAVIAAVCWLGTVLALVPLPISVVATIGAAWLVLRHYRPGAAAEIGRVVGILVLALLALALLGGGIGWPELVILAILVALAIWWPHRSRKPDHLEATDRETDPSRTP